MTEEDMFSSCGKIFFFGSFMKEVLLNALDLWTFYLKCSLSFPLRITFSKFSIEGNNSSLWSSKMDDLITISSSDSDIDFDFDTDDEG